MITVDQLLSFSVHWFYLMGLHNIFFYVAWFAFIFFFLGKYSYTNTPHLYQKQKKKLNTLNSSDLFVPRCYNLRLINYERAKEWSKFFRFVCSSLATLHVLNLFFFVSTFLWMELFLLAYYFYFLPRCFRESIIPYISLQTINY